MVRRYLEKKAILLRLVESRGVRQKGEGRKSQGEESTSVEGEANPKGKTEKSSMGSIGGTERKK